MVRFFDYLCEYTGTRTRIYIYTNTHLYLCSHKCRHRPAVFPKKPRWFIDNYVINFKAIWTIQKSLYEKFQELQILSFYNPLFFRFVDLKHFRNVICAHNFKLQSVISPLIFIRHKLKKVKYYATKLYIYPLFL